MGDAALLCTNGTCAFANCPLLLQNPDMVTGESNDELEPRDDDYRSDPDQDDDTQGDHSNSADDDNEPPSDAVNQYQGTSSKYSGCGTGPARKKQVGDATVMMAFEQRDMAAIDELLQSGEDAEEADPPIVNIHVVPTEAKSSSIVLRQGSLIAEGVVNPHTDFLCDPTCRPNILPWESLTIEQKLDENDFRTKLNLWCFLPKVCRKLKLPRGFPVPPRHWPASWRAEAPTTYVVPREEPWYPNEVLVKTVPNLLWLDKWMREEKQIPGDTSGQLLGPPVPGIHTRHREKGTIGFPARLLGEAQEASSMSHPSLPGAAAFWGIDAAIRFSHVQYGYGARAIVSFTPFAGTIRLRPIYDDLPLDVNARFDPSVNESAKECLGMETSKATTTSYLSKRSMDGASTGLLPSSTHKLAVRPQFLADTDVPSLATTPTATSSPRRRPVARRSGIPVRVRPHFASDNKTREDAKPLSPRDISSDPFDPNNIIDGPRLRRARPSHHSSHHVTLAVDNSSNVVDGVPTSLNEDYGYEYKGPMCLLTHTMHFPEKQKRLHPDVVAARNKEVRGLYDIKCLAWATRDQAKEHGVTPIHTGFVDAVKHNESTGERVYKSRLVMFGNRMNAYEHFSPYETSTPVAHHFALLLLCAIMVALNAFIKQVDFSQAYTHADMGDVVFAVPPDDFKKPGDPFAIWRVFKALYGSPQAGRRWHDYIASSGPEFPPAFTTIASALPWVLLLKTDDMLVFCFLYSQFEAFKKRLEKGKFRFKDMNDVRVFTVHGFTSHYLGDDEDSMPMLDNPAPDAAKQKKD
eukprot:g68347.t1